MTITSKPYQPSPTLCCEGCAFGDTTHADWCSWRPRYVDTHDSLPTIFNPALFRKAIEGAKLP